MLPKAASVMRFGAVCHGATAMFGGVVVLFPAAFGGETASAIAMVLAALAAILGFVSLIVAYYRDRDYFPFLFGVGLGLSTINRGFLQVPEEKYAASALLQFANLIPPVISALLLWHGTRRLSRNEPSIVAASTNP